MQKAHRQNREHPREQGRHFLHQTAHEAEYRAAVAAIGLPCVVKPVMSSSGKGQSTLRSEADIAPAWEYAQTGGRAGAGRCIVEGFIDFDYEITLLTVRHAGGTSFCDPIGHTQEHGDYRESWQPQPMSALVRACSRAVYSSSTVCGRKALRTSGRLIAMRTTGTRPVFSLARW